MFEFRKPLNPEEIGCVEGINLIQQVLRDHDEMAMVEYIDRNKSSLISECIYKTHE